MALSDFRSGRRPFGCIGVATSTRSGSPPNYPDHLLNMPCSLPRRIGTGACRFLPCPRGLPPISAGSASATSLSRPAQASLALRPAQLLTSLKLALSQGSDPISYPIEPLVSYHVLPTTTWEGLSPT